MASPTDDAWLSLYMLKPKELQAILAENQQFRERMVDIFTKKTMGLLATADGLHEMCNFDVQERVRSTIKRVVDVESQLLVWAPTQSGKSAYKAVEIACYLSMGMHITLCTKGKGESISLAKKIKGYFEHSDFYGKIFDVYSVEKMSEGDTFSGLLEKGSIPGFALVIPDTHEQIEVATKMIQFTKQLSNGAGRGFSFALILDECDAIEERSPDKSQDNERAMEVLKSIGTTVETRVTATPLPVISRSLVIPNAAFPKVFIIPPHEDYVGTEALGIHDQIGYLNSDSIEEGYPATQVKTKQFNSNKGKQGLSRNCKQEMATKFPLPTKKSRIPVWNIQCNKVMDSALKKGPKSKGVLVLVGTCTGVNQDGNLFQQAAWTQDHYCFKNDQQFVAIVFHADNVFYRLPGDRYGYRFKGDICGLIKAIDGDAELGLGMPVVIFGYHALKRSRSLRSQKRVPTHLILYLRGGQSIENVRQASGRATFNGQDLLQENMNRSTVTTLMTEESFRLAQEHDGFVRRVLHLGSSGKPLQDVVEAVDEFRSSTKRKSGVYDFWKEKDEEKKRSGDAALSSVQSKRTKSSSAMSSQGDRLLTAEGQQAKTNCNGDGNSQESKDMENTTTDK